MAGITEEALKTSPLNFTMPESDVTVSANYVKLHAITVTDGTVKDSDGTAITQAASGDSVTFTATDKSSQNQRFREWTATGVSLNTPKTNPLSITMPDKAVTLSANYVTLVTKPTESTSTDASAAGSESLTVPVRGDGKTDVSAKIADGTATVGEITEKALDAVTASGKTDTMTIDISGAKQTVTSVVLTRSTTLTAARLKSA